MSIFLVEDGTIGIKMVDPASEPILLTHTTTVGCRFMMIMSGCVGRQIQVPAHQLLADEEQCCEDGCLFPQLGDLMYKPAHFAGILLAGGRDEDLVSLHVTCRLMMLAVAYLPGEIGNTESCMQDKANGIVQGFGLGESLMATFVREDPQTCHDEPLNDGENAPEQAECDSRLDSRSQDVAEKGPVRGKLEEVSGNISQAAASGADKAVLWNGGPDLIDFDVW